ncbi:glycosyltransferase family 9 protein [Bacteriovorax sp. Seq25_V]|uniref:glycosyltransferase family 9 protein n=1 Tax=Bacteriovorax sp. Seq25_V TaxID=1201288 RepID=UPI000389F272|nr:glycosyltransferase family 9 protein [Bacteriovorax sp. Seq25_V]EQC43386.1 heptosyltransferase domain protein [Bacteriovorax sp. Seq25_V]
MKELLIINLKRNGDIFASGHIIRSFIAKYPEIKISLLVLKEFEKAALNLKGITEVHTIDRKKILTYKKNKIFSDGFALDEFQRDIGKVTGKTWDAVYNLSNDRVSTHLTSLLKTKSSKHIGIRFNETCNIEYSSEWAIVMNDILTSVKYAPVTFTDTYLNMANLKPANESFVLKTKEEYNKSSATNFAELRKVENNGNDVKLIGIQLTASTDYKSLSKEQLINLIDALYMSPNFFPILLAAPTEQERNLVSIINSEFNNSLVSVEADFLALNSVLMNLDLLITPDTAIKHLADLTNTPTIEISLGESPLFKQGSLNQESFIVTPTVSKRVFSKKTVENDMSLQAQNILLSTEDIVALAKNILFAEDLSNHKFAQGISVYSVNNDELGTRYELAYGAVDQNAEIERLISRQLLLKKFTGSEDLEIYNALVIDGTTQLESWLTDTKLAITEVSKNLLGTLRSLLQVDGSKAKTGQFLKNLTELLAECEVESQFMAIPLLRFRARVEALNTSNLLESAREMESLIYELKADIQVQVDIVKTASDFVRRTKDSQRTKFSKENQYDI